MYFQWLKISVFTVLGTAETSPHARSSQKYEGINGLFGIAVIAKFSHFINGVMWCGCVQCQGVMLLFDVMILLLTSLVCALCFMFEFFFHKCIIK